MKELIQEYKKTLFHLSNIACNLSEIDKSEMEESEKIKLIIEISCLFKVVRMQDEILNRLNKMVPIDLFGGDYVEIYGKSKKKN